ncbi:MAG: low molecular weight phosphatase family protein [Pirellulaceae bacterium]|nr:low molecular weight phosphatase family protein [Pirellulaceae bacterium]
MSRLLFLCSGNYYRSRYAEILFNHLARQQGVAWTADSRGFRLSPNNVGKISQHTAEACQRQQLAYDPDRGPAVVMEADFQAADRVIAVKETEHRPMMRQRFPEWENKIEYWEIDDIDCATPDVALVKLAEKVQAVVSECSS